MGEGDKEKEGGANTEREERREEDDAEEGEEEETVEELLETLGREAGEEHRTAAGEWMEEREHGAGGDVGRGNEAPGETAEEEEGDGRWTGERILDEGAVGEDGAV